MAKKNCIVKFECGENGRTVKINLQDLIEGLGERFTSEDVRKAMRGQGAQAHANAYFRRVLLDPLEDYLRSAGRLVDVQCNTKTYVRTYTLTAPAAVPEEVILTPITDTPIDEEAEIIEEVQPETPATPDYGSIALSVDLEAQINEWRRKPASLIDRKATSLVKFLRELAKGHGKTCFSMSDYPDKKKDIVDFGETIFGISLEITSGHGSTAVTKTGLSVKALEDLATGLEYHLDEFIVKHPRSLTATVENSVKIQEPVVPKTSVTVLPKVYSSEGISLSDIVRELKLDGEQKALDILKCTLLWLGIFLNQESPVSVTMICRYFEKYLGKKCCPTEMVMRLGTLLRSEFRDSFPATLDGTAFQCTLPRECLERWSCMVAKTVYRLSGSDGEWLREVARFSRKQQQMPEAAPVAKEQPTGEEPLFMAPSGAKIFRGLHVHMEDPRTGISLYEGHYPSITKATIDDYIEFVQSYGPGTVKVLRGQKLDLTKVTMYMKKLEELQNLL